MTPIAKGEDCQFQPFSQVLLLAGLSARVGALDDGAGGICYGLAVAWLESMEKKSGSFIDDVADFGKTPVLYRAYTAYRHQQGHIQLSISGTFSEAENRKNTVTAARPYFGTAAITQNGSLRTAGKMKTFGLSLAGMRAFCAWLGAASGTRYFMLSVPGHAMAAVGSSRGTLSVFDPNCGIVSSTSQRALAVCLYRYFSSERINAVYQNKGQPAWLTVSKFKH